MRKRIIIICICILLITIIGIYYLYNIESKFEQQLYNEGDNNSEAPTFNKVVLTNEILARTDSSHPTDVFISIIDYIEYVFKYNPSTTLWDWYDFEDGSVVLTEITPGTYYVSVNADCLLTI